MPNAPKLRVKPLESSRRLWYLPLAFSVKIDLSGALCGCRLGWQAEPD
jgi:hypothetical protein